MVATEFWPDPEKARTKWEDLQRSYKEKEGDFDARERILQQVRDGMKRFYASCCLDSQILHLSLLGQSSDEIAITIQGSATGIASMVGMCIDAVAREEESFPDTIKESDEFIGPM